MWEVTIEKQTYLLVIKFLVTTEKLPQVLEENLDKFVTKVVILPTEMIYYG